jgi:hypothetical protein
VFLPRLHSNTGGWVGGEGGKGGKGEGGRGEGGRGRGEGGGRKGGGGEGGEGGEGGALNVTTHIFEAEKTFFLLTYIET